jgi:hypothetical protein
MIDPGSSTKLIDPALLFRFRVQASKVDFHFADRMWQLPDSTELPKTGVFISGQKDFASIRAGVGKDALFFQASIDRKLQFPWCRESRLEDSDGLHIWIDTRASRDVHRATRFCHRFVFCPMGRGPKGEMAFAGWAPINRARENSPPPLEKLLATRSKLRPGGYDLYCAIHFTALSGLDINDFPVVGFYYAVVDRELGWQSLGLGPPLPVAEDPGLWGELRIA